VKTNNNLSLKMPQRKKDLDSPSFSNEIPSDARTSSFFIGNCFAIVSLVMLILAVLAGIYKWNESKNLREKIGILETKLTYVKAQLSNVGVTTNNLEIENQDLKAQARCIKILVYELDPILASDNSDHKLPFSNFKAYVNTLRNNTIVKLLGTEGRLEKLREHFNWMKNKAKVIIFSRYMEVENIKLLCAKMEELVDLSMGYVEVHKTAEDEGMDNLLKKLMGKDETLRPNQVFFIDQSFEGVDDVFNLHCEKNWLTDTDLRNIKKIVENTGCEHK